MTAWTPEIRVVYLPPNTDKSTTPTEITSWVDYSINISRGTSEFISPPYPGQTVLSLLFDTDYIPDIELGSWIEIQVLQEGFLTWSTIQSGVVTSRSSSYRAYGLSGYVLEWQFAITSSISLLQNSTWYNPEYVDDRTDVLASYVLSNSYSTRWNELNRNLTWQNYGPQAWDQVDENQFNDFPYIDYGIETTLQALDVGYRNTWDDLVTLVYGLYGYIIEFPNNQIYFRYTDTPLLVDVIFTPDKLSPEIVGGDGVDTLRNTVTLSRSDGVQTIYYESDAISRYGQRTGSLDTCIVLQNDLNDIGQKILNSTAYPLLSTKQISMNLLNPAFDGAGGRSALVYGPLGLRVTVEAPEAMGGTQDYLTIGCNYTINRNEYLLDLTLVPYLQVYNTQNWDQIPYNYTWTSYGVAFPTQEWQDL